MKTGLDAVAFGGFPLLGLDAVAFGGFPLLGLGAVAMGFHFKNPELQLNEK
jgi:hypothetical protein